MIRAFFLTLMFTAPAFADSVTAARTIRPNQIIAEEDVKLAAPDIPGAVQDLGEVLGKEARVAIYPGRPIMRDAVREPALVGRNQLVEIVFSKNGLRIAADGRALGRGGVGERIRVMNLESRSVLFGTVAENGTIQVTK